MPVKVRCPKCKKVLTAPDAARGKAIKCRNCEARVRVPAAKTQQSAAKSQQSAAKKKQPAAKKTDDDHDFLSTLNLKHMEDTSVRVCPKCGAEVDEDEIDCPECGVNLETGMPGVAALKARRRGPDPDEFYRVAREDSWKFVTEHRSLVVRTTMYWLIFPTIAILCGFMFLWCHRTPPKAFWGFCGFVSGMVAFGWVWFLQTVLINVTLEKKNKVKRVSFDFFQCSALGIKILIWQIAFVQILTGSIAYFFFKEGNLLVGFLLIGAGVLVSLPMVPSAMVHMSMPVTYRGWLSPVMIGLFSRTVGPSLFLASMFVVTNIPIIASVSVIGAVYSDDFKTVIDAMSYNSLVATANDTEPPKREAGESELPDDPHAEYRDKELEEILPKLKPLIMPGVIWLMGCLFVGFAAVFNARANGQFAWYFKGRLDLITEVKQVEYKAQEVDELGDPIVDPKKQMQKKIALGVGGTILFYVVGNVILYFSTDGEYLLVPRYIAVLLKIVD